MATRSVIIGHELGMDELSADFEEIAGDNATRKAHALRIKGQIIAVAVQHRGDLIREIDDTDYDYDEDDDEESEVFNHYTLTFEFPDDESARRASKQVRSDFAEYGVYLHDPDADEECQASFMIPDGQEAGTRDSIYKHIVQVCDKYGAEQIQSDTFRPMVGSKSLYYKYQFNSENDIESSFAELRKLWDKRQVRFGWGRLREKLPHEMPSEDDLPEMLE